ncbi:MAG: AraC family transcriptional regulator [Longimonas sp.]|uniref:AraC family transcriptional regulator n=1 Tax=Longimonas sp. TaxID=2039626 RepID=UPI00335B616D
MPLTHRNQSAPTVSPSEFHRYIPGERLESIRLPVTATRSEPVLVERFRIPGVPSSQAFPRLNSHLLSVITRGQARGQYSLGDDTDLHEVEIQEEVSLFLAAGTSTTWAWEDCDVELVFVYIPPPLIYHFVSLHALDPRRTTLRSRVFEEDRVLYLLGQALNQSIEACTDGESGVTTRAVAGAVVRAMIFRLLVTADADVPPLMQANQGPLSASARRSVQEHIRTNLDEDISVADLAEHLDMSPSHFSRLFKQTVGYTPYRYVLRERVRRARHLLAETDLPIASVALQAGFSNQSHLTRWFRRVTHTTPASYRKAMKDGETSSSDLTDFDSASTRSGTEDSERS